MSPGAGDRVLRVGVFFGGVSPEHEVSVVSAAQAMAAMDRTRWMPVPVYIGKDGAWWTGEALRLLDTFRTGPEGAQGASRSDIKPGSRGRLVLQPRPREGFAGRFGRRAEPVEIDLVFPVMHGGAGENGSLQGLCETIGVPYAGSGPLSAALAMDKAAAKRWAETFDIPQVPFAVVEEREWAGAESEWLDRLEESPGLPAIVKPAGLGSSIGIERAIDREALDAAIEDAFRYDRKVVIEKAVGSLRELNCSVLGRPGSAEASVLEEPLSGDELLSFRDKYLGGASGRAAGKAPGAKGAVGGGAVSGAVSGAGRSGKGLAAAGGSKTAAQGMASLDRRIPAPVEDQLTGEVRSLAVRVFEAFGCRGVVRIDFLMDGRSGEVYFNEINTMPGSLSFYLWEPSGVSFPELINRILDDGLANYRDAAGRVSSYDVNLLSERDLGGLKGAKG